MASGFCSRALSVRASEQICLSTFIALSGHRDGIKDLSLSGSACSQTESTRYLGSGDLVDAAGQTIWYFSGSVDATRGMKGAARACVQADEEGKDDVSKLRLSRSLIVGRGLMLSEAAIYSMVYGTSLAVQT